MSKSDDKQESLALGAAAEPLTQVEKYEFGPIKGYPMLNWRGKRPFTSTQYYPAQLKEVHGEEVDGWRNKIYWGDNLQVMSHLLKQFRGEVDLVYIDPPYDSKADYKRRVRLKGQVAESALNSFEEKQYGDIWSNDEYLQFMYERLCLIRELLRATGSIYLHCDWHRSHHLRCLMDEVFGPETFRNEIIWKRRAGILAQSRQYGSSTDTILFYTKSSEYVFSPPLVKEGQEEYVEERFNQQDKDGRRYRLSPLLSPSYSPTLVYDYKGVKSPPNGWSVSMETMRRLEEEDRLVFPNKPGGRIQRKQFLDEWKGSPIQSLWVDIPPVNPVAAERLDYPTQKPERLLERIVQASCPEGGLVFDCFMGSGTAQSVAMKLGRRFIGADINLGSIQTTTRRLIKASHDLQPLSLKSDKKLYAGFEVYNVNHYDVFRNPVQAKELLVEALEIQKLEFNSVYDGEKDGRMYKVMPVNRIATRADLNELIAGFDYKSWERKQNESPNKPIEKITLVCMGHEPDLAAQLELAAKPFKIEVMVVDILRDKANLEFKRDSEAKIIIKKGELCIERFYPMNLLQKLSLQKEGAGDWREMVESVLIDWNYDGAVLQPSIVDIPPNDELVAGRYEVPADAGTIRVRITDLLSESWEGSVTNG